MRGMTLRAIAEACNGVYYGSEDNLDKEVTDITTDSRKVRNGGLFVAYVARELTDTNTQTTALMMERCVLYQKKNLKDRLILI